MVCLVDAVAAGGVLCARAAGVESPGWRAGGGVSVHEPREPARPRRTCGPRQLGPEPQTHAPKYTGAAIPHPRVTDHV